MLPQFEVVLSEAISFSQDEDNSTENDGGDEDDENGDGDAQDGFIVQVLGRF